MVASSYCMFGSSTTIISFCFANLTNSTLLWEPWPSQIRTCGRVGPMFLGKCRWNKAYRCHLWSTQNLILRSWILSKTTPLLVSPLSHTLSISSLFFRELQSGLGVNHHLHSHMQWLWLVLETWTSSHEPFWTLSWPELYWVCGTL